MTTLRDQHLRAVARRLAALLKGSDDPAVFVGAPDSLVDEIARLFDVEAICHDGRRLSYRTAVAACAAPPPGPHTEASDPALAVLVQGLSAPATLGTRQRQTLAAESLAADLQGLLHVPLLRMHVGASDPARLAEAVRAELGERDATALVPARIGHTLSLSASLTGARALLARPEVTSWQVAGEIVLHGDGGDR